MAETVYNTVFISYRRSVSQYMALAVFQHLKARGYDVFYDINSIDAGHFDRIILGQIAARAHFLPILTVGSLERCVDKDDWLRREIEEAIRLGRNIVPLMMEGFKFSAASHLLVGDLAQLSRFNGLNVPVDYFDEAMTRLQERFLKLPFYMPNIALTPLGDQPQVQAKIQEAEEQPKITEQDLTAEEYISQGYEKGEKGDYFGEIADYTEAIRLKPDFANAYYNRGIARAGQGDLNRAIQDYNEAIRLKPDYILPYNNRGNAHADQGDLNRAIQDYNEAIRLKPNFALPYNNRGNVRKQQGDLSSAIQDYTQAIQLKPDYAEAYNNRGNVRKDQGDLTSAIQDYTQAIRLKSNFAEAYNNRGITRQLQGDLSGALIDWDEAIRLKPDFAEAYYNRGLARYSQGDLTGAIQDYTQTTHLKPDYAYAYWGLGNSYYDQGKRAEALAAYEKYLALAGNNPSTFVVGRVKELRGKS